MKCENFVRGREEGWVNVSPVLLGKYDVNHRYVSRWSTTFG